tara:strand:+ start:755 stop:1375 length:621 start_codon:yes stop_codon:yes gene_type:complete
MKVNVKTLAEKDKAKLSDSNSLAFNGARAKRISYQETQNDNQTQKCATSIEKDHRNHINAPPSTLSQLTRLCAERELNLFKRVGKPVFPRNQFSEIKTYFNGTAQKSAFACLAYANYYDAKCTTTGRAAHQLGMNRASILKIITYSLEKGWMVEEHKHKYQCSLFMVDAMEDYTSWLMTQNQDLFNAINGLKEAYIAEKSGVLPIK